MSKKGLYEEYCNTLPIVRGYREFDYTVWLENELLKLRKKVNKNCNTPAVSESVCDHHWVPLGHWENATAHQCTKCNLIKEQTVC